MKTAFEAEGDIRDVDLLAAFVALWREAAAGSLRFARGPSSASFDLEEGEVIAVHSSEPRFETAAILVRAGKLDPAALERLSIPPAGDGALAALQAGILTKREWKWGEKIRAIEILADLLSWPDGKYSFQPEARGGRGEFVLAIPRLLLELFLRSRDRNLIDHQLGPTDRPLQRSARFEEEFATFGLTADAESVVRLIDGAATASEISERAPAEEFAVLKLLAALKTLGLLETEQPPRPLRAEEPVEALEAPGAVGSSIASEPWSTTELPALDEPAATPSGGQDLAQTPLADASAGAAAEREWSPRGEDIPSFEPPAEDAEVEPIPADWTEPEPQETPWEPDAAGPLDQPLDLPEPPPPPERSSVRWGLILGLLLVFLVAAVVGTVMLRSWSAPPLSSPRFGQLRSTPPATRPAAPVPSAAATPEPTPAAIPTPLPARPTAPALRSKPVPTERPPAPTARPTTAPTSAAPTSKPSDSGRGAWLERARRDARRLKSEPQTRYSIQLELVCEVPSLADAWRHDRPAGSLWLLTSSHGGRDCFRVLWGRYGSLEEARRAKGAIPPYFVTASNHPAVVSVR